MSYSRSLHFIRYAAALGAGSRDSVSHGVAHYNVSIGIADIKLASFTGLSAVNVSLLCATAVFR
jgi:hypothetical protein